MLLEDMAKQPVNRAPIARFGMVRDRLIEIVGVADYLAVVGMARNGAEAIILRYIIQIVLPEVSFDGRNLPIDKTLTSGAVCLWSQHLPVIVRTYADIRAPASILIRQIVLLKCNVRIFHINHLRFIIRCRIAMSWLIDISRK